METSHKQATHSIGVKTLQAMDIGQMLTGIYSLSSAKNDSYNCYTAPMWSRHRHHMSSTISMKMKQKKKCRYKCGHANHLACFFFTILMCEIATNQRCSSNFGCKKFCSEDLARNKMTWWFFFSRFTFFKIKFQINFVASTMVLNLQKCWEKWENKKK